ncbi:MAG: hypothetical protein PHT12_05800 [Patescibacteria group bacterium]|nr:hypothetical protein [Patescibacteria group bacterium]
MKKTLLFVLAVAVAIASFAVARSCCSQAHAVLLAIGVGASFLAGASNGKLTLSVICVGFALMVGLLLPSLGLDEGNPLGTGGAIAGIITAACAVGWGLVDFVEDIRRVCHSAAA